MSDTPRTDEREHASFESVWSSWVEAAFARQLERELAAERETSAKLLECVKDIHSCVLIAASAHPKNSKSNEMRREATELAQYAIQLKESK